MSESSGLAPNEMRSGVNPCRGSSPSLSLPLCENEFEIAACSSDLEGAWLRVAYIVYAFTCNSFDCELF